MDDFEINRNKIKVLINKYGIKSTRQLCLLSGITQSNLYSNLNGTYEISIKRMFALANTLGCPVDEVIEVFYPDLIQMNRELVSENKVPVECK